MRVYRLQQFNLDWRNIFNNTSFSPIVSVYWGDHISWMKRYVVVVQNSMWLRVKNVNKPHFASENYDGSCSLCTHTRNLFLPWERNWEILARLNSLFILFLFATAVVTLTLTWWVMIMMMMLFLLIISRRNVM